ncbi:Galactose-binding domain-like [Phytophthora cactorum]|nr:Galactose-binding domain-like [Phytophthora cactorum]
MASGSQSSILLDFLGLTRGRAYINGHDLGRYWLINDEGDFVQRYYHVPRDWLVKDRENLLIVFDELGGSVTDVRLVSSAMVPDTAAVAIEGGERPAASDFAAMNESSAVARFCPPSHPLTKSPPNSRTASTFAARAMSARKAKKRAHVSDSDHDSAEDEHPEVASITFPQFSGECSSWDAFHEELTRYAFSGWPNLLCCLPDSAASLPPHPVFRRQRSDLRSIIPCEIDTERWLLADEDTKRTQAIRITSQKFYVEDIAAPPSRVLGHNEKYRIRVCSVPEDCRSGGGQRITKLSGLAGLPDTTRRSRAT